MIVYSCCMDSRRKVVTMDWRSLVLQDLSVQKTGGIILPVFQNSLGVIESNLMDKGRTITGFTIRRSSFLTTLRETKIQRRREKLSKGALFLQEHLHFNHISKSAFVRLSHLSSTEQKSADKYFFFESFLDVGVLL